MSAESAKRHIEDLISLWHGIFLRYVKNGIILNETKGNNMIVRIGCIYSYDMDFNDYMFEQRLRAMGVLRIFSTEPQRRRGVEGMEVTFCCFSEWNKQGCDLVKSFYN